MLEGDTILEINPDIVRAIIVRLRQFQVKDVQSLPDDSSSPIDDNNLQVLTDIKDDSIDDELRAEINDLELIQQVELVALLWLGRGDYDVSEWNDLLDEAKRNHNNRTAEYLLGTPLAADYIEEGLALLGV